MLKYRLFLLFILLCSGLTLSAQLPDTCEVPSLVRTHYLPSAKVLALRQMLGDPAWADSVQIPLELYEPILEALSAVYNATQYPQRDTVTECLDIQAFATPISPSIISLYVDTNVVWAQNLHNDIFPTGNATVDNLLLKYQLEKAASFQQAEYFFSLRTDALLNTAVLAGLFNVIPGVQANAATAIGEGNDITLDTVAGGVTLTYTVAWGDCPAGCIFERDWTFLVESDCSAEFVQVQGNPLTSEVVCNNTFSCSTEPLCLPWLQDSLSKYLVQQPCVPAQPDIHVTLYQKLNSSPVIAIHVFIGIDAAYTDYFYCNGDYIGSCNITIAGAGCTDGDLLQYQHGDTIWDCSRPLPTAADCGVTAVQSPVFDEFYFELSPNPTYTGEVFVRADFGVNTKGRLSVVNTLGKMILEKRFESSELNEMFDLGPQLPGIYLVRMEIGGRTYTQKVIRVLR